MLQQRHQNANPNVSTFTHTWKVSPAQSECAAGAGDSGARIFHAASAEGGSPPVRYGTWNTSLGRCGERGSTGRPCASCRPEVIRIVPAQSARAGPGPEALPHRREGARAVRAAECPGGELTWAEVAALTAATPLSSAPSPFHAP